MAPQTDSLSQQAYHRLETLIVTLELKPGATVNEKQLIDLAGQGRTPVREAIQKLEWQGLIKVRPRVGLQISEIVPGDYSCIIQVRKQLEPLCAALVAQHASERQRQDLVECAKTMGAAAATGDMLGFLVADKDFDDIFEEACPNKFLIAALTPPQTHSRRMWFSTATLERLDQAVTRHVGVIRAIQSKDVGGARKAMEALVAHLAKL